MRRTGDITYLYSGYELIFGGLSCECESQGPEPPSPEDPHGSPGGPSVSAGFKQNAIIFEDAYENEPGVTIPRRSTDGLGMQFRVLPLDVSFSQISVEEVPSTVGYHTGYFANSYFANEWCHSRQTGAGRWVNVSVYNICGDELDIFSDRAALVSPLPRMTSSGGITEDPSEMWIDGSNIWIYPFGWNVKDTNGLSEPYGCFATGTSQEFTIDSLGTTGVRKLGHSVSREISGVIHLDSDEGEADD